MGAGVCPETHGQGWSVCGMLTLLLPHLAVSIPYFSFLLLKIYMFLILEKKGERERERNINAKNIDGLPPVCTGTGD